MSNDYDRKARVGQSINMAHSYILAVDTDVKSMTIDTYKKELQDKTQVFFDLITSIQSTYEQSEQITQKLVEESKKKELELQKERESKQLYDL